MSTLQPRNDSSNQPIHPSLAAGVPDGAQPTLSPEKRARWDPLESLGGKTVLVTGGSGFVGRHLVNRLRQNPQTRLVLLNRKAAPQPPRAGEFHISSSLDRLTRRTWNAANIASLDVVFHFAAFTPKTRGDADRIDEVYRDNLNGARALLESLPVSPMRIVFASTLDVYAPTPPQAVLSEGSPVGPCGLYGASKLFGELLVASFARRSGCQCAILRYGHLFGPGEEAYGKLVPEAIRLLLRGEAPIVYGDGSVLRDLLYVEDAVEATLRAAVVSPGAGDPLGGPVNIVCGESRSVREVVESLTSLIPFSGRIRYRSDRPAGASFRFDASKMRAMLGDWERTPLERGLMDEIQYMRGLTGSDASQPPVCESAADASGNGVT